MGTKRYGLLYSRVPSDVEIWCYALKGYHHALYLPQGVVHRTSDGSLHIYIYVYIDLDHARDLETRWSDKSMPCLWIYLFAFLEADYAPRSSEVEHGDGVHMELYLSNCDILRFYMNVTTLEYVK